MLYALAAVLFVISVVLLTVANKRNAKKAEMDATGTTPIGDLGESVHAEIKGVVSCDQPLTPPNCDTPCVQYTYRIERRERHTTGSGKGVYRWRAVDSGEARVPFKLTDQSGTVVVDPDGAEVDARRLVQTSIDPTQMMGEGTLKTLAQATSDAQRITVDGIPADLELYVLGDVTRRADGELRVAKGANRFFISTKSEEQLTKTLGRQAMLYYVSGGVLLLAGVVVLAIALVG